MTSKVFLIWILLGAISGCISSTHSSRLPYQNPSLNQLTSERLEQFESTSEFTLYLQAVQQIAETEYRRVYTRHPDHLARQASQEDSRLLYSVAVTASRVRNPSITNNQEAGVEEGDIVKQIDDFLVILQDGRLFSINTKPGGEDGLVLAGRQDVYLSDDVDTWYDEMLVSGNKIVVTGYSYDVEASEVSIFTFNPDGSFTREDTFYIASDDYYDSKNYATRIVGDKFIVHTPIYLSGYSPTDALAWPVIRHWQKYLDFTEFEDWSDLPSNSLLRPQDIYRPIQGTIAPVIHTITICEIGAHRRNEMMECDASAFVAPEGYEFYVSTDAVFLWTWPDGDDWAQGWDRDTSACEANERVSHNNVLPSTIYEIPIDGTLPKALKAVGRPFDQFSMVSQKNRFHALIDWTDPWCDDYLEISHPTLFSVPLSAFSTSPNSRHVSLEALPPFLSDKALKNRFVGEKLVYSTSDDWGHYPPYAGQVMEPADVSVVSVLERENVSSFQTPHSVIRLEALGNDAIVTGYADDTGLSISSIALSSEPTLASTIVLKDRFESEGRSHAFNATVSPDSDALMGIPTVERPEAAGRWWWSSESSGLSFLAANKLLGLSNLGTLKASEANEHDTYECEVSCVDWYGNFRPIFTSGRIFALSGTKMIEGQIIDGIISEKRSVDMTAPITSGS